MAKGRSGRVRLYIELLPEVAERLGREAEAREMHMSKFLQRITEEALEALRPVKEWRLTTLPTYDPTELEKRKHPSGPDRPCQLLQKPIRAHWPDAVYCQDCGWRVDEHLDA